MESPNFPEPKSASGIFFSVNSKLVTQGIVTVPVYRKFDGNFVKIANDPREFIEVFEKKKFGDLYIPTEYQSEFYETAATAYLNNLREKLNDPKSNEKEIAGLVVNWADICLGEMMTADSNMAVKHLQTFVSDFLTGFKNKNLNNLMNEIQKLEYSTAQHSIETMLLTINYFSPQNNRRFSEIGAIAALLHDIGKQKIDPSIISKPGPLNDIENTKMKEHPDNGVKILEHIDFKALLFSEAEQHLIVNGVAQHHEREDGSGYPNNLHTGQISDYGKILAIIDTYAVLTSNTRPYQKGVQPPLAINILKKEVTDGKLNGQFLNQFLLSLHSLGIDTNQQW